MSSLEKQHEGVVVKPKNENRVGREVAQQCRSCLNTQMAWYLRVFPDFTCQWLNALHYHRIPLGVTQASEPFVRPLILGSNCAILNRNPSSTFGPIWASASGLSVSPLPSFLSEHGAAPTDSVLLSYKWPLLWEFSLHFTAVCLPQ